jgi:hypothetical protein
MTTGQYLPAPSLHISICNFKIAVADVAATTLQTMFALSRNVVAFGSWNAMVAKLYLGMTYVSLLSTSLQLFFCFRAMQVSSNWERQEADLGSQYWKLGKWDNHQAS